MVGSKGTAQQFHGLKYMSLQAVTEQRSNQPDFSATAKVLRDKGASGAVEAAAGLGCDTTRYKPEEPYYQKMALKSVIEFGATCNGSHGDLSEVIKTAIDTLISLENNKAHSAIGSLLSRYGEISPLLTNPENHKLVEGLLERAFESAVTDRYFAPLNDAALMLAKYNCQKVEPREPFVVPTFVPSFLRRPDLTESIQRKRGDGFWSLSGILGNATVGDFLVAAASRTRPLTNWIASENELPFIGALSQRMDEDSLKRYANATSGRVGESEIFRALMAKEKWIMPSTGTPLGVYSDIGNTLLGYNWRLKAEHPIPGRIEQLKAVIDAGIPVHICTGGDPYRYQETLRDLGLRAHVYSKDSVAGKRVHILLDDALPESQEAAPDPDVYIRA